MWKRLIAVATRADLQIYDLADARLDRHNALYLYVCGLWFVKAMS